MRAFAASATNARCAMSDEYIHGYDSSEQRRLRDQAATLAEFLHAGTRFSPGDSVLEVGCGVGAQTIPLAAANPQASFLSVDVSEHSLAEAAAAVRRNGLANVAFQSADLFDLPLALQGFDHVFVCFVLEHLRDPLEALRQLSRRLKPGCVITVIEGDHGSAFFSPDSDFARRAIQAQVDLQAIAGGDANIGRRLYPLLREAGLGEIIVEPRQVYVDGSRPAWADGFTRKTFAAMIAGVRDRALREDMMNAEDFDRGVTGLLRAAEPDGVFAYTFFKATARAV
jgi:ubiquinone/menaquinone biosynthesis C-methylase UbiE